MVNHIFSSVLVNYMLPFWEYYFIYITVVFVFFIVRKLLEESPIIKFLINRSPLTKILYCLRDNRHHTLEKVTKLMRRSLTLRIGITNPMLYQNPRLKLGVLLILSLMKVINTDLKIRKGESTRGQIGMKWHRMRTVMIPK